MLSVTLGAIFGITVLPASVIGIINILFLGFMIASAFVLKRNIFTTKLAMNSYCFVMGIV
jgi:hypothetical protein